MNKFCYLVDMISAAGGVEESIAARIKYMAGRNFGSFFQACARNAVLYGNETWAVKEEDSVNLERIAMIEILLKGAR